MAWPAGQEQPPAAAPAPLPCMQTREWDFPSFPCALFLFLPPARPARSPASAALPALDSDWLQVAAGGCGWLPVAAQRNQSSLDFRGRGGEEREL